LNKLRLFVDAVCPAIGATTCCCMNLATTIRHTSTLQQSTCRCNIGPAVANLLSSIASQRTMKCGAISLLLTTF